MGPPSSLLLLLLLFAITSAHLASETRDIPSKKKKMKHVMDVVFNLHLLLSIFFQPKKRVSDMSSKFYIFFILSSFLTYHIPI